MKHLLIILSILLLSSPLLGQSSKYESVSQCVLKTMKERDLTGNDMFEMVKEECKRILGKLENRKKKKQKGVLFSRKVKGEWGWFVNRGKKNYSKWHGEIKNGLPNGKGTEIMSDGSKYVGDYYNGERRGQGTMTDSDGGKYNGGWENFQYNGKGTYTFPNGEKYVGEWKDGEKHGEGAYTFPNGEKYVGGYKDGEKDGNGTLTRPDGTKYVGEYKKGKANGQGIYIFGKGRWEGQKYVGAFKNDLMHGKGTTTALDGTKYTGIYKNGRLWNGTVFQKNGEKIYQRINGEIKIIISDETTSYEPPAEPTFLPLGSLLVKLKGGGRFLKTTIQLMLSEPGAAAYLSTRIIEVKDIVLAELQELTVQDMKKSNSRKALRKRLKSAISQILPSKPEWGDPDPIRKVLFEEIVIQ